MRVSGVSWLYPAIELRDLPGYTPHLKGTVERLNESIEQLFLADLPGFVHGSRNRAGKQVDAEAPILRFEQLVELFADFVARYNADHRHTGLGGRTPLEQWNADATPLHTVPAGRLRHLLLEVATRVVTKRGVRLGGKRYNCAELCGHVGETVEVRFMPHHDHEVEVYRDGRHLSTALLVDRMSRGEAARLIARRHDEARWLAKTQRAAAKNRRVRYAAMTEPGSARVVSVAVDRGGELAGYDHADERAMASRSLVDTGPVPERMVVPRVRRAS